MGKYSYVARPRLNGSPPMDRREREDMMKIVRSREKVAKTDAVERSRALRADFEKQISAIYNFDDSKVWQAAMVAAKRQIAETNKQIAEECERLGIPKQFAPAVDCHWYGRGENACRQRRDELRRAANAEIASREAQAKATIARRSVEAQEKLIVSGLVSAEARAMVESLPTIEALMPPLKLAEIEHANPQEVEDEDEDE